MRAVEITRAGGPEVLAVVERPIPQPSNGEMLLQIKAAGVSRADSMQRAGSYPPPPGASDIPGLEAAGIDVRTGDPVCALLTGGGYAEYVAVPREQTLPIPQGWNFCEAATLPENMFTVYDNVFTRANFHAGESILIHGGSSGIGTTAIMLAKAFGATLIAATAGSEKKCAACREVGADDAFDYHATDFVDRTRAITDGKGVDVILDIVGGDYLERDLEAIAADGRIVCLATARGRIAQLDLGKLLERRAAVMGSSLRARTVAQKGEIARRLLRHVWPRLPARDPIRPLVDSVFDMEHAADAHRRLEASQHIGKIVISMEPGAHAPA